MGKLTISIAMFNSYVKLPKGNYEISLPSTIFNGKSRYFDSFDWAIFSGYGTNYKIVFHMITPRTQQLSQHLLNCYCNSSIFKQLKTVGIHCYWNSSL